MKHETPQHPPQPVPTEPPLTHSSNLLCNGTLRIAHQGAIYTLRATSKGGLILTK